MSSRSSNNPTNTPVPALPTSREYRRGELRGACVEGYETFDLSAIPWDTIKRNPDPDYELAKSSRTRRVVRTEFTPTGGSPRVVYAKRVLVLDWSKRVGDLFMRSKARHEWEAGRRLLSMGIATARPVVCAELWRGRWSQANYLVTEAIDGAQPVRQELEPLGSTGDVRGLLADLAQWLWWVHGKGFYHDDCSSEHVFVGPAGDAPDEKTRKFCFIDLDNCRFHRATVPWRRRVRNLFQLLRSIPPRWASRTERLRFLWAYLKASGETHRLRRAVGAMRRIARGKGASTHL